MKRDWSWLIANPLARVLLSRVVVAALSAVAGGLVALGVPLPGVEACLLAA